MKVTPIAALLATATGFAQLPDRTVAAPQFEVASVKPCRDADAGGRSGAGQQSFPGRVHIECQSVMSLIAMAYVRYGSGRDDPRAEANAQRENRIQGGPGWIHSASYQIDAKPEGAPSQETMMGPMLRGLLEDKFRLAIHREAREMPVYELTVAKGGAKLQAAKDGGCITIDRDHPPPRPIPGQPLPRPCGGFSGDYVSGTTVANLCGQFSAMLGRPVIDKTGISGVFDIYLDSFVENIRPEAPDGTFIRPEPGAPPARPDPDVVFPAAHRALQKLGLMLESAKGAVEYLVIDHVERPGEN
jgi:uncharacterized protein (TIGR03435 family)